jgi:class 3 adenylate cyclase/predicted ATPase
LDTGHEVGGERRRVTVLFCDLVGSTRLSDQLDPEDYSDIMHSYYDACSRVIEGLGGWIADYLGDGLVVYFGYPEAHEDDPVRAVRAGLRLIDAVSDIRLQRSTEGGGLACRVGIETGLVVIGDTRERPREPIWALGRTVNIAARLQQIGSPNSVVIGHGTQALVTGWFALSPLGQHAIKGIAEPVEVALVTGETGVKDRIGASFPRNLVTLVDREDELATLEETWKGAAEGNGGAVVLRGEAGIGKSRLALALRERLKDVPKRLVVLYCSQDDGSSPLRPILEHLERDIGFSPDDLPDERLELLRDYVERTGSSGSEDVALLTEMLVPEAHKAAVTLPAEERRRAAMDLLGRLLVPDATPTFLLLEDIHWSDPSTAELIAIAVERSASRPALVLATTRPEFDAAWLALPHASTIDLPTLGAKHTAQLAAAVAGIQLPREGEALILARSGGVPLFVEELTREVLDAGLVSVEGGLATMRGRIAEDSVPGTVYDLLVARLGRLGEEAGLAQLASVLGNEFSRGFLRAVASEETEVDRKLERLLELGVVERRGEPHDETFRFTHALVRDAAYGLLLRRRRRELHGLVADVMVREFPETVEAHPELAAPHFTQSGRVEEAIGQWTKAGERAVAQYALHEAIDHYVRALELVRGLEGSPERARQEIELSFALGPVIQNASGFGDPRVGELYGRIAELSHWLESDVERFTFLAYGYAVNMVRADYATAKTIALQLVEVSSRSESTTRRLLANCCLGTTLFQLGEFSDAMPLIDHAIELYDAERHQRLITAAAIDPGVVAIGYRAWGEWHLGLADRARRTVDELLALTEAHPHPFSEATARVWAAGLAQRLREPEAVRRHAEIAIALAAEHDYEELERYATCLLGWSLAMSGSVEEGVRTIRRGLALVPHGGSRAHLSWHLLMLAEAELLAGDHSAALDALRQAREFSTETGERVFEPELWRLEAEALHGSGGDPDAVDAALVLAADIAARHDSLPFRLRAAASRYRLRPGPEAHMDLAARRAAFTEGFDAVDLLDADALLGGAP